MREVGKRYLFRSVPFFLAGRLLAEDHAEHTIDQVVEVFNTGDYPACLEKGGVWQDSATYPAKTVVYVPRGTVIVELP